MGEKKTILMLTGSPRRAGNSSLMADAFVKGAEQAGHSIVRYDTGRMKINGCTACDKCYSKATACVFEDDFNELAPYIEKADMIVFATPLYWYTFPAQIKAAIDKMYSLYVAKRTIKIDQAVMLVCGETDELPDFDGIVKTYEAIIHLMKWKNAGIKIVPAVDKIGDIHSTNALAEIENMAAKF